MNMKWLSSSFASSNLLFLFVSLFVIDNQYFGVSASSTCPYKLLESAFEVQVDLEQDDNAVETQKPIVCLDTEKSDLAELIEKGIQKASQKVVEHSTFLSLDESNASVCKAPEEDEESRRLLATDQEMMSIRKRIMLKRHLIFRYHGGMRCSICQSDDSDDNREKEYVIMPNCSESWKTSSRTFRVPFPQKVLMEAKMRLNFVILREIMSNGKQQHMLVTINQKTVDFGKAETNEEEGERSQNINGFVWKMNTSTNNNNNMMEHKIEISLPKEVFRGEKYLDLKLTFDGEKDGQGELSAEFGTKLCYFYEGYALKKSRRLVSSPVSSPTTMIYSSPTTMATSPVSSLSGPVGIAESLTIEEEEMMMSNDESSANVEKAEVSDDADKNNNYNESVPKPSFQSQKAIASNNNKQQTDTTTTSGDDDDNNNKSTPEIKSQSKNLVFQKIVRDTLTSILNNDLKVAVSSNPDHCMYEKKIKAVVHLTSKPEWEKNIPTCNSNSN